MSENEAEIQHWWREACPLYAHMGLEVESAGGGIYRCRVPLSLGNSNHFKTMHAAIQLAVAEVLGGIVGMSMFAADERAKVFAAVRSISFDFLRPAKSAVIAETLFGDDRAEKIRATVMRDENAEFELESVIRLESGEVIARSRASYVLRPWRGAPREIVKAVI